MGKGRNRQPGDADEDDYADILPTGHFPNGLPKVCWWYDMEGDIRYVRGEGDERLPVLEDLFLQLDFKKGMHIFVYHYMAQRNPYDMACPATWDHVSDYLPNDREAAQRAVQAQERHAAVGEYIPIYIRE